MKAIILVAGFGTRLYPLTQNLPKALLKFGDKTILDYLLEKLEPFPIIDEVILVSNGKFYFDFVEWQKTAVCSKPIRIVNNNVYEPAKSLGAVRDLDLALRAFRGTPERFLVFCGDNFFDFSIGYFLLPCLGHSAWPFIGLYDVKAKSIAAQCGVVQMDDHGRIVCFEEKPADPKTTSVSVGVYYLPAPVRLRLHEYLEIERLNPDKIGDFIGWLTEKEPVYGVEFDGTWFDIGTKASYEEARRYVEDAAPH